jgi:hypothetical protein
VIIMAKGDETRRGDRRREFLFVGSCAVIFLILAACAVYAVVMLAT